MLLKRGPEVEEVVVEEEEVVVVVEEALVVVEEVVVVVEEVVEEVVVVVVVEVIIPVVLITNTGTGSTRVTRATERPSNSRVTSSLHPASTSESIQIISYRTQDGSS
jgi:hypothetical protein